MPHHNHQLNHHRHSCKLKRLRGSEQLALQVQVLSEARVREHQHTYDPLAGWMKSCTMDKMYSTGWTLQRDSLIFHSLLLQMNFVLSHLICSLCSINWLYPSTMQLLQIEEVSVEQGKVVCTLLNARSQRVNGLQLLISFMVVVRATSKQASKTGSITSGAVRSGKHSSKTHAHAKTSILSSSRQ